MTNKFKSIVPVVIASVMAFGTLVHTTGAQSTANQALSTAQSNSTAIEAINEKIDRMFKKSVSK